MKKLLSLLLVFSLIFTLVACSGNTGSVEPESEPGETASEVAEESSGEPLAEGRTDEEEPEDDLQEAGDAEEIEEEGQQTAAAAQESTHPAAQPERHTDAATGGKTLVVYISHSGTTAAVAGHITNAIDADVFVITPVDAYPGDYNTHLDVARQELSDDKRPAIQGSVSNMADYDTILLGYPIWWGYAPRPVATFLESHDLSGKTIAPFCTSGSSGMGRSADEIAQLAPGANVASGLSVTGNNTGNAASLVQQWLAELGLL